MALTETQALAIIQQELEASIPRRSRLVRVGIGDDCAVLRPTQGEPVWTLDCCNEGSHFLWEWMSPEDVAHKSFHAAISDVCAMGVRPHAAIVHLTLSPRVDSRYLRRFARRQAELSQDTGVSIVGGNLSAGDHLGVVTSVLGFARQKALLRSGARPGDELWLVGDVGLAWAGLKLLEAGRGGSRAAAERTCLGAFRRPSAQLSAGPRLMTRASSCLDVSDGLRRDARRIAESSGVRVVLKEESLRDIIHEGLQKVCLRYDWDPLELILDGGEDYAILATGAGRLRPKEARNIGCIEEGGGLVIESESDRRPLIDGFEHRF